MHQDGAGELTDVIEPVRRVVRARCSDPVVAEDLVQETLVRVAEMSRRAQPDVLQAYAIRVAMNLVVSHARETDRNRRRLHRLTDLDVEVGPEGAAIDSEETAALANALGRIDRDQRRLLELHEVDGVDVGTIAEIEEVGRSSVAMRLLRARAALRLEFVLAYRKRDIPAHCRSVLMALATGDSRRQAALDAGDHLDSCETCEDLCQAIVERRRAYAVGLAGVGAALVGGVRWLTRPLRRHPGRVATGGTLAAAGLFAAVAVVPDDSRRDAAPVPATAAPLSSAATSAFAPTTAAAATTVAAAAPPVAPEPPAPEPPAATRAPAGVAGAPLVVAGQPVPPLPDQGLAARDGQPVVAAALTVDEVPHDEGFWLRVSPDLRIWVALAGEGESPVAITAGLVVALDGVIRGYAEGSPIPVEQADEVAQLGAYIDVRYDAVRTEE
jgi:RNA polymerase sigma factor (sigma-70 family)